MKTMKAKYKLNNSELKVMDILWEAVALSAKEIVILAGKRYEWNKNTTYTVLKGLIEKQYIERTEPGFVCTPLIEREVVQASATKGLIDRLFNGSASMFLSAFLENEPLTDRQIEEIQEIIRRKQ